jgi:hypothetical protein
MEDDDYSKVNIYKIIEGSESNDFIATINCEDESSEQIDIEEDSKYLLSIYLESYDEGMDFSLDIE